EERDHWIKVEHRTNKCTDTAWLTVVRCDLDIDTANLCGTSEPSRSFQEDCDEEKMAKIIQMNDMDADGDYIPDFLDGFGIFSGAFNDGEIENGNNFYPLVLECVPPDPEYSIRFDYDCPDNPSQTGFSTFSEAANAYTNAVIENPLGSGIRIWTKPESVSRNPAEVENGGDFVKAGVPIKIGSLFPDGESKITLYIEGIGTISSHVLPFIKVSLARSNGTDIVSDQVAYLVVRCVYYLCVYRPYVYDETNDARSDFFLSIMQRHGQCFPAIAKEQACRTRNFIKNLLLWDMHLPGSKCVHLHQILTFGQDKPGCQKREKIGLSLIVLINCGMGKSIGTHFRMAGKIQRAIWRNHGFFSSESIRMGIYRHQAIKSNR
ncbi:MAG: hypothetical protein ACI4QT_10430, partial [Kiritimatiellia bacterium]